MHTFGHTFDDFLPTRPPSPAPQAVASEHWFVYSFLDTSTVRQQATVMELYDATPR